MMILQIAKHKKVIPPVAQPNCTRSNHMSQQTMNTDENPYADDQATSVKPLLLAEAIWQLPRQYLKVMCRPSARTFREELGKASWGIVLVQFYALVVITVALT